MAESNLNTEQQKQMKECMAIADQFVKFFYQQFDTNRELTANLYNENAIMSFEGVTYVGPLAIVQRLQSLTFQQIAHVITTIDAHPLPDNAILVVVVGQLKADADAVLGFNQSFMLRAFNGSFQITNDIFRLALHHG